MALPLILSLVAVTVSAGQDVTVTTPDGVSFGATWTDAGISLSGVAGQLTMARPAAAA